MSPQREQGVVVEVAEYVYGDELAADSAAGAVALTVADTTDFNEDGGSLLIGTETLAYTSADDDTGVLSLAAPVTGAYLVGERVVVSPDTRERLAMVRLDTDGEAVEARVPHALYDRIAEGTREDDGEPVSLYLDGDEWVIEDLLGLAPVVDGTYIDPATMPDSGGNAVYRQDDPPWAEGTPGMPDNDLWYDTDAPEGVTPYLWDAANMIWLDVSDPKVDLLDDPGTLVVGDNTLDEMQGAIVNNYETAHSAQDLASTADGRISISDYDPTDLDVAYFAVDADGNLIKGSQFGITGTQLTSSIATLSIDAAGGLMTMDDGGWIVVTGVGAPYDGEWQITAHTTADPYTVSYRIGGAADLAPATLDPQGTGFNTLVQQRVEGSIWYTRTRARKNFCTNPSFEVDLAGWAGVAATLARVADPSVIAGGFVAQVTNSSAAGDHRAEWTGGTPGLVVEEAQVWATTCFALAVSGTNTGCYASARFYNAAGGLIGETAGPVVDLDTADWQELKVPTVVPALGVAMAAIVLHNPNPSAVWKIDGALAENADYTGRYFDGDSYDATWLGTPDQSASQMTGGKIISVYELYDSNWVRMDFTGTTSYDADASDLTQGTLDQARLADNSVPTWKLLTNSVIASDPVTAGQLVNVWSNNGLFMVRPADASVAGKQADGFVRSSAAAGAAVPVYALGYITGLTGLSPGLQFLQTVPGKAGQDVPNVAGQVIQQVGYASDATILHFRPEPPVLLN